MSTKAERQLETLERVTEKVLAETAQREVTMPGFAAAAVATEAPAPQMAGFATTAAPVTMPGFAAAPVATATLAGFQTQAQPVTEAAATITAQPVALDTFEAKPAPVADVFTRVRRIIPLPFGMPPLRGRRFYLPAAFLHEAYLQRNGYKMWQPGDVLDFTKAGIDSAELHGCSSNKEHINYESHRLEEEERDPHQHPLTAMLMEAEENPLDLVDLAAETAHSDTLAHLWYGTIFEGLVEVRKQVLNEPELMIAVVGEHCTEMCVDVLEYAGYDFDPGVYSGEKIVGTLLDNLNEEGVAASFADRVATRYPHLVSDEGRALFRNFVKMKATDVGLVRPEKVQFFAFERLRDPQPGPAATWVDLQGRYVAKRATYRSALDELGRAGPPMVIAWREIAVVPAKGILEEPGGDAHEYIH
jgi:hypothetical protein